jgi:hypothetical protein
MRSLVSPWASLAVLGVLAFAGGTAQAAPAGCSAKLSLSEIEAANTLATRLDTAITTALADNRSGNIADLRASLINSLEAVLVGSNASPAVGRAALIDVRDELSNQGLVCAVASPTAVRQGACREVREILDLVAASAQSAQSICATAIGDGIPALGPPPPGNNGGQGPGVTHPGVAPAI